MTLALRLMCLFSLVPLLGIAGTWSGALVDSKCYASAQFNRNPHETSFASTDQGQAIRYCSPKAKTKVFAIVQQDGSTFKLDSTSNQTFATASLTLSECSPAPERVDNRQV